MSVDWTIEIANSSGTWDADGFIPRPNEDLETNYVSTIQKIKLADGSYGYVSPETKRVKETFTMFFADTTSDFRLFAKQISNQMQ